MIGNVSMANVSSQMGFSSKKTFKKQGGNEFLEYEDNKRDNHATVQQGRQSKKVLTQTALPEEISRFGDYTFIQANS